MRTVDAKIRPDQLTEAVSDLLKEYGKGVDKAMSVTITHVAEGALKEVKAHAPVSKTKHRGTYKKNLAIKKTDHGLVIWGGKSYMLTSLLEHGHQTRNHKGRTKAIPHFQYGQDYVEKNFERILKENLDKID